jgi:hypothetical protein
MDSSDYWHQEASFGQASFTGKLNPTKSADIFGIYQITENPSTCDFNDMHRQAKTAAATDGFTVGGYHHVIVMLNVPSTTPCTWGGLAMVGGTEVWVRDATRIGTTIHEIGHNFGLRHATRSFECIIDDQPVIFAKSSECRVAIYGDEMDPMGNTSSAYGNPVPHYSAISKSKIGWIPATNVATVTSSGVYDLYPSEEPSTGTQLIRIPAPYDLTGGHSINAGLPPFFYYLELRKPVGVQSNISARYKEDYSGVVFRTGSGVPRFYTYLYQLGSLPGAEPCANCITGLRPGMVFEDPHNPGFSIKVLSWTPDKATVEIQIEEPDEPPECVRNDPPVTVSPFNGGRINPGDTVDYTVTVTNNNSFTVCPTTTYTITPSVVSFGEHFSISPASKDFVLAPGDTGVQVFSFTASSSAIIRQYNVRFAFTNSDSPNTITQSGFFNIVNPLAIPPTINISGIANGDTISPSSNTKITAIASHSTGISKVEIFINNQLVAKCNEPKNGICDIFIKGSNTVNGTHTLRVVATAKNTEQTTGVTNLTFSK